MGCGNAISKFILICLNTFFFLAGLLMLCFGIVSLAKPELIFNFFSYIPGIANVPKAFDLAGVVQHSSVFMIVVGAIVGIIGLFGCFGVCCNSKCLLKGYIIALFIILALEIALIIFAAVFPSMIKETVQSVMRKSLDGFHRDVSVTNDSIALSTDDIGWALLQFEARCCGAYNYTDYASVGWDKQYTINGKQIIATVPMMCCKTNDDVKLDDFASINERGLNSTFKNLEGCLKGETESINDQNCYSSVHLLILKYSLIAIGIAAGICGLEVMLIIMACCISNNIDKDD